jgi:TonB family protein
MIAFRKFTQAITAVFLCVACMMPSASVRANSQQSSRTFDDRDQGIRLYEQGNIDGALKALRSSLSKSKDDAIAWHYLGLSLVRKEDLKGARKAFEKAVELRQDFAPARAALANTLLFTSKAKEAEKQAKQALVFDPQNAEAHYVLGTIRLLQGSCAEALAQADAALVGKPDFPQSYLLRSQSLICEVAKTSLRPWTLDGAIYKTSVAPTDLTKDEKLLREKATAQRFKEAASNLERFLQLAPAVADAPLWREQMETLRLYAEPADKPDAERTVFTTLEVTTKARVLSKPEPTYTKAARDAYVEGTVVLRAIFTADGNVKNILVLSPLPNGLTERSINAARKIKFQPATKDGRPVAVFIQIEYNFNLY